MVEGSLVGVSTRSVSLMVELLFSSITIEVVQNLNGLNRSWISAWRYICLIYLQGIEEVRRGKDEEVIRVINHRFQVHGEGTRETEIGSKC